MIVLLLLLVFPPSESHQLLQFRGGGIYYYFQAGFCQFLQDQGFTDGFQMVGSSAGSLSAALLACDVDFQQATDFVVDQAERYSIYERKSLAFIWGDLIEEWLEYLLPEELPHRAREDVHVTLTPMRLWQRPELKTRFKDKADLKTALMASVHIPVFLNGKLYTKYKGRRYMDGSLYSLISNSHRVNPLPVGLDHTDSDIYTVDYKKDAQFLKKAADTSFVSMVSPQGLYDMMESGYAFAGKEFRKGLLFPERKGLLFPDRKGFLFPDGGGA